jgi:hypothetical protein
MRLTRRQSADTLSLGPHLVRGGYRELLEPAQPVPRLDVEGYQNHRRGLDEGVDVRPAGALSFLMEALHDISLLQLGGGDHPEVLSRPATRPMRHFFTEGTLHNFT